MAAIDPETQAKITRLEALKNDLFWWRQAGDQDFNKDDYRAKINRNKRAARQLMIDADCHRKVPVHVLRQDGSYDEVYVDPFDVIFEPPDSHQVVTWLIDMADETIGVLQDEASSGSGDVESNPGFVAHHTGDTLAVAIKTPVLDVRLQRGRLELVDPPPESPLKLNQLADDLPDELAAVTKALTDLIAAVKGDNSALGETVKRQLIAMLEVALQDLKAPYADVGRLARTRDFITTVGTAAATGAATATLTKQFENAATALGKAIDWLVRVAS